MDVANWLNSVALRMRELANSTMIMRDDTNRDKVFTPEEHAILARWIEDTERMEAEAVTLLKDWTALRGEEKKPDA